MYKPNGITNICKKDIPKPKTKVPKLVILFLFIVNVCFGLDFGITKLLYPRNPIIGKVVTALISIGVIIILMPFNGCDSIYYFVFILILTQYITCALVQKFNKYSVYDFISDVHNKADENNGINSTIPGLGALIYVAINYCLRMTILTLFFIHLHKEAHDAFLVSYFIYGVFSHSLYIIPVTLMLTYYYIYCCIKYLCKLSSKSVKNINLVQHHYMALIESFDKIKYSNDKILIIHLLFEIPKLMTVLWEGLHSIKYNFGWVVFAGEYIYALPVVIDICVLAVIGEKVNNQLDKIKEILYDQLMTETDEKKIVEMNRLLRYMKARSLQRKAWGIVPVDLRLPVSLFSICTTYFIVLIQFTHLYD